MSDVEELPDNVHALAQVVRERARQPYPQEVAHLAQATFNCFFIGTMRERPAQIDAIAAAIMIDRADRPTAMLRKSLERVLLEFDFLVEGGHLPDIRNDIIFEDARKALEPRQ